MCGIHQTAAVVLTGAKPDIYSFFCFRGGFLFVNAHPVLTQREALNYGTTGIIQ